MLPHLVLVVVGGRSRSRCENDVQRAWQQCFLTWLVLVVVGVGVGVGVKTMTKVCGNDVSSLRIRGCGRVSDTSGGYSEQDGRDCCDDGPDCCYSMDTEIQEGLMDRI
ncbi:hypothetical protein N9L68_07225 [bacterium]|nr:hypothetical protein [bacterium]